MIPLILSRPLVTLDLETTGLDAEEARIVEIGMMVQYPEKSCSSCLGTGLKDDAKLGDADVCCTRCKGMEREPTLEWRTIVNPLVPIPVLASEVTGITDAHVQACRDCLQSRSAHLTPTSLGSGGDPCQAFKPWPTFAQLAGRLARFLASVDYAGKHVRYDLRVLSAEMRRHDVAWSYEGAAIIDADAIERVKEPRDLSSLYRRRCGKEPQNAHQALADVKMTAELIAAQLTLWPDLPQTPWELHALLWGDWIDSEGKFRFDALGRPIVRFGKHEGKEMKDVPRSYWDFVLSPKEKFSEEIKQLAREAKLGKFPTR